jgi:hypothetical protein
MAARALAFLWTLRLSQSEWDQETIRGIVSPANDVARGEGWREHLFHPGAKGVAVHGALDQHGGVDPVTAQAGDERVVAPVSMRDSTHAGDPARRASAAPCHLGVEPAFVNEDEP